MELSSFVVGRSNMAFQGYGLQRQATYHLVDSSVVGEACVFGVRVSHHPGIRPAGVRHSSLLTHSPIETRKGAPGKPVPAQDGLPAALLPARHLLHGAVELWLNPVEITYEDDVGLWAFVKVQEGLQCM